MGWILELRVWFFPFETKDLEFWYYLIFRFLADLSLDFDLPFMKLISVLDFGIPPLNLTWIFGLEILVNTCFDPISLC